MATGLGPSVDFTYHNISVSSTTSGYGIQLDGNCPVVLCNILRGSVAERAGVKAGDYLIAFNGNDTQESTEDNVGSMLQNSYGSALELRVARPHPLPVSSIDKRRALLTLQNKLRTGDFVTCGAKVDDYRSQLNNALSEVDDILGGFDLPQMVPSYGGTDQEVEIQMYDVDNLSSPPSSVGSDTNLTSYDPLLDFTKQDGLDHQPGVKSAGAEMNESVENMQRQMKNMKVLMKDVSDKKSKKQRPREQTMRTEAALTPSYPLSTTRTQPSTNTAPKPNLDRELAELDELQDQIQWVSSPMGLGGTSNNDPHMRKVSKRIGQSPPPKQTEVSEYPPARNSERSVPLSSRQNEQTNQLRRSASPPSDVSGKPLRKPKKSREKSPPIRESKREKSPPLQQPEHAQSPPFGQPERAVSPTSKAPGRLERFFKRSKSPPLQSERSVSPPAEQPVSSWDKFSVPLRHKKKVADHMPGTESSGYVEERHKAKKMSFGRLSSKSPEPVLPTVEDVTSGLSDNIYGWTLENVGQWIKQLNVSLYTQYFPFFSKHHVTGRTLLRLTSSKLKVMGITNAMHCRVLATEIGKLKIRQEQAELRELQFDSEDETGIVTDL